MKAYIVLCFALFIGISLSSFYQPLEYCIGDHHHGTGGNLYDITQELFLREGDAEHRRSLWQNIDRYWDTHVGWRASVLRSYSNCLCAIYIHKRSHRPADVNLWTSEHREKFWQLGYSYNYFVTYIGGCTTDPFVGIEHSYLDPELQRSLLYTYLERDPDLFEITVPNLADLLEQDIASLQQSEPDYEPREQLCLAMWNYVMSDDQPVGDYVAWSDAWPDRDGGGLFCE